MGANSSGIDVNKRGLLTPDFFSFSTGALSGSTGVTRNTYDGTWYLSGGVNFTNPSSISFKPAAVASAGWILGANSADATNSFFAGASNQGFLSVPLGRFNFYGAITHSFGGATALEFGIASPGSFTFGYTPFNYSTVVFTPKQP